MEINTTEEEGRSPGGTESDKEKFENYCNNMTRMEIEKIFKDKNKEIIWKAEPEPEPNTEVIDVLRRIQKEPSLVKSSDEDKSKAVKLAKRLESLLEDSGEESEDKDVVTEARRAMAAMIEARNRSLLTDKLNVESGKEEETVQRLIKSFKVEAKGEVEEVLLLDTKKRKPVLLIQFDSKDYRDAVLNASKDPVVR